MKPYYQDSVVTIYHGDCLEVMASLPMVDHVITDPPYSRNVYLRAASCTATDKGYSGYELKRRGQALARMGAGDIGAVDELISPVSISMGRLVSRWAVVFSDAESMHRWREHLETSGMRYVRTGAWVKPDSMPQMSGDRPSVGFEPCTIFHRKAAMRWNGGGRAAVWMHNTTKGDDRPDHPCPKPLPLMSQLVGLFTDPGETILDPFMGSGTTLRAAKDAGRKAIGIEISERYCEVAAKRMEQEVLFQAPHVEPEQMQMVPPSVPANGKEER